MALEIFRRKEQKYLITKSQYEELVNRISPKMRSDKNGIDGKYTVTSLYFESPDKTIYFETKNKLRYRQKLRLRVYDDTDENGTAFFEIKQKHKKILHKTSMMLKQKEEKIHLPQTLQQPLLNYETSNEQVMREIHYFRQSYALYPEMIVSYDRHAMHRIEHTQLRMTFHFN